MEAPSGETLRLEIRKFECFETYAAKYGDKAAKTRFKGNGKGLTASRLLRLGCMDHTPLDAVAVLDATTSLPLGRPYLTILIDVRTERGAERRSRWFTNDEVEMLAGSLAGRIRALERDLVMAGRGD